MTDCTPDEYFCRQIAQKVTNTTVIAIDRFHVARTVGNISADDNETVNVYTNDWSMSVARRDSGDAVVSAVTCQYDGPGRQRRITDGRGIVTVYGYDAASRLVAVSNATGYSAEYQYLAGSDLIAGLAHKSGGSTVMTVTKVYDNLSRLTGISSVPSASSAVTFSYTYNLANQRTKAVLADGTYWDYGY